VEDIFSGGKRGQCITHSDLIVAYTGKTKLVKIVDYKLKICTSLVKGLNNNTIITTQQHN
jgi:Ni2+-binding GTPase involved in maturation of urease and hydrogenase